jgi:hypothetical protein
MSLKQKMLAHYGKREVMVNRVIFSEEESARRFARFLNRHLGSGQASLSGSVVTVGAVPIGAVEIACQAIDEEPVCIV